MKYSISTNEENYHGQFDTLEEAIEEGVLGGRAFYVGENRPPRQPEFFFDAEQWLERVSEQDDYCLECAEDWDKSTHAQHKELEASIAQHLGEWLDRHNLRPRFWLVENVRHFDFEGNEIVKV